MELTKEVLERKLAEYQQAAAQHEQFALANRGAAEAVAALLKALESESPEPTPIKAVK